MRALPQVDFCATLNALFPGEGASLAEAYALLDHGQAEQVLASRGTRLHAGFAPLSPEQTKSALRALWRYRQDRAAGKF